jgi:putative intracellular protease/amidase
MRKKILVVLTSVPKYPNLNRATGLWLGEAVHFVKKVEAAGYAVDYVSPEGGYTPIDPHSLALAEPVDWEWYLDKSFMNRLGSGQRRPQPPSAHRTVRTGPYTAPHARLIH